MVAHETHTHSGDRVCRQLTKNKSRVHANIYIRSLAYTRTAQPDDRKCTYTCRIEKHTTRTHARRHTHCTHSNIVYIIIKMRLFWNERSWFYHNTCIHLLFSTFSLILSSLSLFLFILLNFLLSSFERINLPKTLHCNMWWTPVRPVLARNRMRPTAGLWHSLAALPILK